MNDAQIEVGEKIKGKITKNKSDLPKDAAQVRQYIIRECGVDEGNVNLGKMVRAYTDLKNNKFKKPNEWLGDKNNGKDNSTGKFINLLKNDYKDKYDAENNTFAKITPKSENKEEPDPEELKKNYMTLQNTLKMDDHAEKVIKESVPKKIEHEKNMKDLSQSLDEENKKQKLELENKKKEKNIKKIKDEPVRSKSPIRSVSPHSKSESSEIVKSFSEESFKRRVRNAIDTIDDKKEINFNSISKPLFITTLNKIASSKDYERQLHEVMSTFENKNENITRTKIRQVTDYFISNNIVTPYEERLRNFKDKCSNFMKSEFKNFKSGDPLSADGKKLLLSFTRNKWRECFMGPSTGTKEENSERYRPETRAAFDEIFKPLGLNFSLCKKNSLTLHYTADEKEHDARIKGKVDKEPLNSGSFFAYDIHEIFDMIENKLKCKLSKEDETNIQAIVELETRDIRNKTNMSHGTSEINALILDIEKYINSKKRADASSPAFKFSEFNRYKLKNILSKFIKKQVKPVKQIKPVHKKQTGSKIPKSKALTGSELMQKLQHLKL